MHQPRTNLDHDPAGSAQRNQSVRIRQGRAIVAVVVAGVMMAASMPVDATVLSDMLARAEAAVSKGQGRGGNPDLPDPVTTPGDLNPEVRQDNLNDTVCKKGYTKSIRPPAYVSNGIKKKLMRQKGIDRSNMKDWTLDHLVALSIGGSNDEKNLWLQPRNSRYGASVKDSLEIRLQHSVCQGRVSLAEAQHAMATDWIAAYKRYGGESYRGSGD